MKRASFMKSQARPAIFGSPAALFMFVSLVCWSAAGQALAQNLPKGIGVVRVGTRQFAPQSDSFDNAGNKMTLGEKYSSSFTGANLAAGKGGAELKRLADELQKFDGAQAPGASTAQGGLLNQLDLGRLDVDLKAQVSAYYVGMGFGISDAFMVTAGVPYTVAKVRASFSHSGGNTASQVGLQLGNLAFDELKDGLNRAAGLNTAMVIESLKKQGFSGLDSWDYSGPGDVQLGSQFSLNQALRKSITTPWNVNFTLNLTLPTGYVERPDVLLDTNIGSGAYAIQPGVNGRLRPLPGPMRNFFVGGSVSAGLNIGTTLDKRVPVGTESIPAADRIAKVKFSPGQDLMADVQVGAGSGLFEGAVFTAAKKHFRDSYSGALEGNYATLGNNTERHVVSGGVSASLTTVESYRRKLFAVPFIVTANAQTPFKGRNVVDDTYLDISFSTFFPTPMASTTAGKSGKDSDIPTPRRKVLSRSRSALAAN